jgi:hypothetical protein
MAGGPLRAWPRPPLRCGHKARKVSPLRSHARAENFAPGPCTPRPSCRPKSSLPEGNKNGRPPPLTERNIMTTEAVTPETPAEVGSLIHVDPHTLEIGDNVRDDVQLDKAFLASLAEHGVLVPITAIRRDDGAIQVRNGQRRMLAAREVGLATVPVYVLPSTLATPARRPSTASCTKSSPTIRSRTSPRLSALGIQQMIDAGLSVTKVAKIDRRRACHPSWATSECVLGRGSVLVVPAVRPVFVNYLPRCHSFCKLSTMSTDRESLANGRTRRSRRLRTWPQRGSNEAMSESAQ